MSRIGGISVVLAMVGVAFIVVAFKKHDMEKSFKAKDYTIETAFDGTEGIIIDGPLSMAGGISNAIVVCQGPDDVDMDFTICALLPTSSSLKKGDTVVITAVKHHYSQRARWTHTFIAEPSRPKTSK